MTARPKHTPEPWYILSGGIITTKVGPDWPTHTVNLVSPNAPGPANAARIVACVNACAGLNPEAIPALIAATEYAARLLASYDPLGVAEGDVLYDLRAALAAVRGEK